MFYAWGLGAKVEAVKGIVTILLKGAEQLFLLLLLAVLWTCSTLGV
jgi:hypothetical protein